MRVAYCLADQLHVPVSSRQGPGIVTAKNRSAAVSTVHPLASSTARRRCRANSAEL